MWEEFLLDLQVFLVLLVLMVQSGLRAFWDLLGRKASQVLQVLQDWMERWASKDLLDLLELLVHRVYRFLQFRGHQVPVEIQELPALAIPAPQDPSAQDQLDLLDLSALSDLPDRAALMEQERLDLLDLPDLLATVHSGLPALQEPSEVLDQLGQVLLGASALPDLLDKGLSESQVLQEISDHPELLGVLVRPVSSGLQEPMDRVR